MTVDSATRLRCLELACARYPNSDGAALAAAARFLAWVEGHEADRAEEAPAALTGREDLVLWALAALQAEGRRPNQAQIGIRAGISPQSVGVHIRRLEQKGRLRREGPRAHRRYVILREPADGTAAAERSVNRPVNSPAPRPARANARTTPFRRFTDTPELDPEAVKALAGDHEAVVEARTLFPSTVVDPDDGDRLLVSGGNSRKLGDRVVKGPWAGMPIYQLTLEERATCPRDCSVYRACYGNGMPKARRHRHGPALEDMLPVEVGKLAQAHPQGFVVRLHVLGDFYSTEYVELWRGLLATHANLRVFGYTHWQPDTEIGAAIQRVVDAYGYERFAVRFSAAAPGPGRVTTLWQRPEDADIPTGTIVCPAQVGKTDCCGTCGLCWHPNARDKTIAFVGHGPKWPGRPPAQPAEPAEERETSPEALARRTGSMVAGGRAEGKLNSAGDPVFNQPVDRRSQGCGRLFKCRRASELHCLECIGSAGAGAKLRDERRWRAEGKA